MSAKAIFDTAPLGAIIQYSDGRAQPPKRFTRKFAAWRRNNGTGQLIRKSLLILRATGQAPASFTLHEGDFASGGTVVLVVHRTYDLTSDLRFWVARTPSQASWRVVQPFGDTTELLHLAEDRAGAEAWLESNRYTDALIERAGEVADNLFPSSALALGASEGAP